MDRYIIYQMKDDPKYRYYVFEGYDQVTKDGFIPNVTDYDEVYSGDLADIDANAPSIEAFDLEKLFYIFNMERPSDFKGHSLSVSDVIVLHTDKEIDGKNDFTFYVDRFGFKEIPYFLTESKTEIYMQKADSILAARENLMEMYEVYKSKDFSYEANSIREEIKGLDVQLKKMFDISEEKEDRTVLLTGLPISSQMKDILKRLEKGEYVPIEEINDTAEIKTASTCLSHQTPTVMLAGRENLQENIFRKMTQLGSANIDDSGKMQYNGDVEKGKRLDIVIGLPGSGKSSALVDVISEESKSLVIDNDDIKKMIPEFNQGWGGDIVHEESKKLELKILIDSLKSGKNVVLPKVGSKASDLINNYIIPAKAFGYTVNVHYVELSREKALGRVINRFIDTGKFQWPNLIDKYCNAEHGNLVEKAFKELSKSDLVDGVSHWDNDVLQGQPPLLLYHKGLSDRFLHITENKEQAIYKEGEKENGNDVRESSKRNPRSVEQDTTGSSEKLYNNKTDRNERTDIQRGIQGNQYESVADSKDVAGGDQSVHRQSVGTEKGGYSRYSLRGQLNNYSYESHMKDADNNTLEHGSKEQPNRV